MKDGAKVQMHPRAMVYNEDCLNLTKMVTRKVIGPSEVGNEQNFTDDGASNNGGQ